MNDVQVCAYDYLYISMPGIPGAPDISAKFPARLRRIIGEINVANAAITCVQHYNEHGTPVIQPASW